MLDVIKTHYALNNKRVKDQPFGWAGPVFLFTNENIADYLKQLGNVSGKDVLTVAASGDHAFESFLCGAKRVDTFDINYLQKHVMELKAKMIQNLSYQDFMRFFFSREKFFDYEIIKPIWHKLSLGTRMFLNKYYKINNYDNRVMFVYGSAQDKYYTLDKISYINDEKAYEHLGKILPEKICFKHTDISNISNKFDGVYDIILMSNIFEYMFKEIQDVPEKIMTFRNKILGPIADKNLNTNGGVMCFSYRWYTDNVKYREMIDAIQRYMAQSVDNFDVHEHVIDMIEVPTSTILKDKPDVITTLTQKVR